MGENIVFSVQLCEGGCGCDRRAKRWHIVGERTGQRMYSEMTYETSREAREAAVNLRLRLMGEGQKARVAGQSLVYRGSIA